MWPESGAWGSESIAALPCCIASMHERSNWKDSTAGRHAFSATLFAHEIVGFWSRPDSARSDPTRGDLHTKSYSDDSTMLVSRTPLGVGVLGMGGSLGVLGGMGVFFGFWVSSQILLAFLASWASWVSGLLGMVGGCGRGLGQRGPVEVPRWRRPRSTDHVGICRPVWSSLPVVNCRPVVCPLDASLVDSCFGKLSTKGPSPGRVPGRQIMW